MVSTGRRYLGAALGAAVAMSVTACAARMDVAAHMQRDIDFSTYKTFAWAAPDALPTGDPRLDGNPFFHDHLQGAVERQLNGRGLSLTASGDADLLLHYHATVAERLDVSRVDREQGYCQDDDCAVRVVQFEAGTIVLDAHDARTGRLVWRGWARQRLGRMLDDPDEMARRLDRTAAEVVGLLPVGAAPDEGGAR